MPTSAITSIMLVVVVLYALMFVGGFAVAHHEKFVITAGLAGAAYSGYDFYLAKAGLLTSGLGGTVWFGVGLILVTALGGLAAAMAGAFFSGMFA